MNILELEQYDLSDAVRFHDQLNPRLWDRSEHLLPAVKQKLMQVAKDFQEFLGVPEVDVQDITISGSNAAYNYTPNSDIDLHLVVKVPEVAHDEVYRELFDAKKYQYNDMHDIRIGGADVELYAQPSDQPHHSQGIYSILHDKWLSVPRRVRASIDDTSVSAKYQDLVHRIDDAVASADYERIANLQAKIRQMRQSGLEQQGEFGVDNIVFKLLRVKGYIKKLIDARNQARDRELSLNERERQRQRVRYGYSSPVTESPDGVNPSTRMFLEAEQTRDIVNHFIADTIKMLGITNPPEILLHDDADWSRQYHSFGMYVPEKHQLHVNLHNRHLLDILRTTAHELCHCRQHELNALGSHAGETGSDMENEAHAVAGIIMRDFAHEHPELFESASGFIPRNSREARMPQYKTAITVDIKPGQVGKEANKLGLATGPNGEPTLIMKTANLRQNPRTVRREASLLEGLAQEWNAMLESDHLDEIKMSPGSLRAEAAKTGAQAGMEFEMIVPVRFSKFDVDSDGADLDSDSDDAELEPDLSADQVALSIDHVIFFFASEPDMNSRRDLDRLRSRMESDYWEWVDNQFELEWEQDQEDFILQWLRREWSADELSQLTGVDSDLDGLTAEQLDQAIDQIKNDQDLLDRAREYARENHEHASDGDWLEQTYPAMSDVMNEYSVTWPFWTQEGSSTNQEGSNSAIADSFSQAVGRPVQYSRTYHGAPRLPGKYVIEPDSSIKSPNPLDRGLEFVSPPLSLDQMVQDLKAVYKWALDNGCYTNRSTGLHINVSVPGFSRDRLDYVKLALLLGDQYVLDQYERRTSSYAQSAMENIGEVVKTNPGRAQKLLDQMRGEMNDMASRTIHDTKTSKYSSINVKDDYIEFRSPGGNYLALDPDQIANTLMRFVVALQAAVDPQAHRQEYLKKLYKLLEPARPRDVAPDTVELFRDYVAGTLDKAKLQYFVKQAQQKRRMSKDPAPPQPMGGAVPGSTQDLARQRAASVRGSQADMEARLGLGPQGDDSNSVIVDQRNDRTVFYFKAANAEQARTIYDRWLEDLGYPENSPTFQLLTGIRMANYWNQGNTPVTEEENEPLGPEFKPTMPAGTVKVDVSDVYDWYKLGQHIANLKGLGHHDFGKGPPSTIISFGDEDTEHKYIKDLERTGLTTTDIDPRDPKQPANMPRQKTDPTYNVGEASPWQRRRKRP